MWIPPCSYFHPEEEEDWVQLIKHVFKLKFTLTADLIHVIFLLSHPTDVENKEEFVDHGRVDGVGFALFVAEQGFQEGSELIDV